MWERNVNQVPPICTLTGDGTHNLGMCPDWELNPQPFGVQDDATSNWAAQPGLFPNSWMPELVEPLESYLYAFLTYGETGFSELRDSSNAIQQLWGTK